MKDPIENIVIRPSKYPDIMKTGRSKAEEFGQTAMKYAYEAAMNAFGVYEEEISAAALEWGNHYELNAVLAYEEKNVVHVERQSDKIEVIHPVFKWAKGHVDGLVGKPGMIEVKCPYQPKNHVENILFAKQYEKDYKAQIQGYLWITGRSWSDFVSYDPRFPEGLNLAVHRFERDEQFIEETLQPRLVKFYGIVKGIVEELKRKKDELDD